MTAQGFNRRQILGAGAAGAGMVAGGAIGLVPGMASAAGLGAPQLCASVIAETAAPESRRFAAAFAGADLRLVSPTMVELLGDFTGEAPLVLGLTSDPVAMIAEQRMVERGGRRLFRWVHRYENGGWHHRIEGASGDLAGSGARWPAALAGIVAGRLAMATAQEEHSCASGECLLARRSPGLLVSFAFDMTRGA